MTRFHKSYRSDLSAYLYYSRSARQLKTRTNCSFLHGFSYFHLSYSGPWNSVSLFCYVVYYWCCHPFWCEPATLFPHGMLRPSRQRYPQEERGAVGNEQTLRCAQAASTAVALALAAGASEVASVVSVRPDV